MALHLFPGAQEVTSSGRILSIPQRLWTLHHECQHLRDEIELLVRSKNLREFVRSNTPKAQSAPPRETTHNKNKGPAYQGQAAPFSGNFVNTIRERGESGIEFEVVPDKRRRGEKGMASWREQLVNEQQGRYSPHIIFGEVDETGSFPPSNRALLITAEVSGKGVARILIDMGSPVDIIYADCLRRLNVGCEIQPKETDVIRFSGDVLRSVGEVTLPVSLGDRPVMAINSVKFLVMDVGSPFNMILGRPSLNTFQAVVSTFHAKIKFPVNGLVGEVKGDKPGAGGTFRFRPHINQIDLHRPIPEEKAKYDTIGQGEERRPEVDPETKERQHVYPSEELRFVEIDPQYPGQMVRIGSHLEQEPALALLELLRRNQDVFAWKPSDLTGVIPKVAIHSLNVNPNVKPVKQKRRHFGGEKDRIIEKEVKKLPEAGHIRRIRYPSWLSNAVLVKKSEDKWRMCIDFRDLNKACPKDHYLLPRIDQLVDSTAGCEMLSMMDASQGYHQIALSPADQSKVSFITSSGTYCYVVMPFGLKNAGATYQRLVDAMFEDQLGRNMEVYVDDILVKSTKAATHLRDLEETFRTLRRYGMKLNPGKCAFGVRAGKFLGYMVKERGIEVNPDQVVAIQNMKSPRNVKEVQTLTRRIAALSRFVSRVA